MKQAKIHIFLCGLMLFLGVGESALLAQTRNEAKGEKYMRSSMYSFLIRHTEQEYDDDIADVFYDMPVSDKFDDHTLSIRSVSFPKDKKDAVDTYYSQSPLLESTGAMAVGVKSNVTRFVELNDVGKQMVSHWFDRDDETGFFDVNLIAERGNYNASELDVRVARLTARGLAQLADAGEELLGNTFFLVHDIKYIDKEKHAQRARLAFAIIGAIFTAAAGVAAGITGDVNYNSYGQLGKSVTDLGAVISDQIAGFTVIVTSHLYRLDWNEENAAEFYNYLWIDKNTHPDSVRVRKERYEYMRGLFPMRYVGSYSARSQKTVLRGLYDDHDVIRKVCTRAIDANIVKLQQKYEAFKVKVPVIAVDDKGYIQAPVGLKEGVTPSSKFEVLERYQSESGRMHYRRIGVVKPVKNLICDNRFMAAEEQAVNSDISTTTFQTVSSTKPFYEGAFIREISFTGTTK